MACDPRELTHVPLFALLDEEETAVLAQKVELKRFDRGNALQDRRLSTRLHMIGGVPDTVDGTIRNLVGRAGARRFSDRLHAGARRGHQPAHRSGRHVFGVVDDIAVRSTQNRWPALDS